MRFGRHHRHRTEAVAFSWSRAPGRLRHPCKNSIRRLSGNRGAMKLAAILRFIERRRAVQRTAVIPDHQIVLAPCVAVDKLRLRAESGELVDQAPPLVA